LTVTRGKVDRTKGPARTPILLSALVYPGLGQFTQRRPVAGLLYSGGFTLLFCVFMALCLRTIVRFYRVGLHGGSGGALPSAGMTLGLFAVCIGAYLANVVDVYMAYRRIGRREAERRFLARHAGVLGEGRDRPGSGG
jgi:hypothetical protein